MQNFFFKDLKKLKKAELATLLKHTLNTGIVNDNTIQELARYQAKNNKRANMKSEEELGEELIVMLENATDWRPLQDVYIRFIKGELPISPTHLGAITVDVQDTNIKKLLRMNELGFITVDSQPGNAKSGTNDDGDDWIIRERQYIQGFLHKDAVQGFIDNLKTYSDKFGEYININITNSDGANLYNNNSILDNDAFGIINDRIPLTIAWDSESGCWHVETSQPVDYWDNPLGFLLQIDNDRLKVLDDYLQDNMMMVNIIAKPWATVGLLDDPVLSALEKSAIPKKKNVRKIVKKKYASNV